MTQKYFFQLLLLAAGIQFTAFTAHPFSASGSPFKHWRTPLPLQRNAMYTYFWLLSSGKGYLLASASGTASCLTLLTDKVLPRWRAITAFQTLMFTVRKFLNNAFPDSNHEQFYLLAD
ncbi:TPA: hypothetical protein H2C15_004577 [Salmonella enterica]|nr:hypothetical protein [Salmonella enterica]